MIRRWIKKILKCADERDFELALANIGNAKDRADFEWKLKQRLFPK